MLPSLWMKQYRIYFHVCHIIPYCVWNGVCRGVLWLLQHGIWNNIFDIICISLEALYHHQNPTNYNTRLLVTIFHYSNFKCKVLLPWAFPGITKKGDITSKSSIIFQDKFLWPSNVCGNIGKSSKSPRKATVNWLCSKIISHKQFYIVQ